MSKCYLDANILNYFEDVKSDFHQPTFKLLFKLAHRQTELIISPLVLDEFLYTLRKALFRETESAEEVYATLKEALNIILDLPKLKIVNPPTTTSTQKKVVALMQKYSLKPRDAYHLLIMKANNVNEFATFDKDFNKAEKEGTIKIIRA